MDKILNIVTNFKTATTDKGLKIRGMASTDDEDRVGDIIVPSAWQKGGLKNFMKNPIILFNHNYDNPIGKATEVSATEKGLEIEVNVSESASVYGLIKDGVLGAFSVGFRIKDADYLEETGGLIIKDAELFEVSVVSVPCNQEATFSLAKSFDSESEYKEYIQTFNKSVNLAGHSLAGTEEDSSNSASDTPEGEKSLQEILMDPKDLEAFAKKVAEDTARSIQMSMAEKEAKAKLEAEKAAAEKAAAEKADKATEAKITAGLQSGTEKLIADFEARLEEKDVKLAEVIGEFQAELDAKAQDIAKIKESKRSFSDRGASGDVSQWGRKFMEAHLLGVATQKGYDTDFARDIFEKAGVDYETQAADVDQEVSNQIEKEITVNTVVPNLFREMMVNSAATVLPIQPDVGLATWQNAAAYDSSTPEGILESQTANADDQAGEYQPRQVILNAYRLVSTSFLDDDIDEQVLINIMPMLVDGVARAHARAVETAVLMGNGTITGIDGYATAHGTNLANAGTSLTAAMLMAARKGMGKYGLNPADVVYIVSMARYFELLEDPEFQDMNLVGNTATKLKGSIGQVYGSEVVVSNEFPAEAVNAPIGFAVNPRNFVIPRLRNVRVERDREVGKQRNLIVASQSLGFEQLVAGYANNRPAVKLDILA